MCVGLSGGIGAGKSLVASYFAEYGALVIDADRSAREALDPRTAGLARVGDRWPETIVDGRLDRPALAARVFSDAAALAELNAIVHPFVRERAAQLEASAGPGQLVVHDVPLLFEAGFYLRCDANVVVVAERETRIVRIVARNGWTRDEIDRRMRAQIDPDRAIELADYTIVNDGTLDALRSESREVYDDLLVRRVRGGAR